MNRSIACCACLVLLSAISFASAAPAPPEVWGSLLSTSPSQKGASAATAESEFPPQNIRPEVIAELIKGAEIVTQTGCSGEHEGKNVGVIINTYHVNLPGFTDEQPVEVGFIQGTDNYIYFKGPGFLYNAEGGNLIRKRLVRLSSIERSMLEEGIRHAITSRTHADQQSLLLVLCKDNERFPPTKECLGRLATPDITLTRYHDWDPDRSDYTGEAAAKIVHLATDRAEFQWKQIDFAGNIQHEWACEFRFQEGKWVCHVPPKQ